MKTIILGASKPTKFKIGAAAIMWWEDTPASHCFVRIEMFPKFWVVFQAVGTGTEFCSYDHFLIENTPVYEKEIQVSLETYEKIMKSAVAVLKRKYSVLHLVGLFYKRLVQYILKKIIKNPFKDAGKSAVCVEALCMIIDAAEIVRKAEDPEDMGVFEAMLILVSLPGKELVNAR